MQLKVGNIVEGKITGITKFGVFVDLGEGNTGMVHISEVSQTYVSEITEHVKVGEVIKVKVLNIGEEGKIGLSIKKAVEQRRPEPKAPVRPDSSYVWVSSKSDNANFEDMMNKYKQASDEKISDLKRKSGESKRVKRGGR